MTHDTLTKQHTLRRIFIPSTSALPAGSSFRIQVLAKSSDGRLARGDRHRRPHQHPSCCILYLRYYLLERVGHRPSKVPSSIQARTATAALKCVVVCSVVKSLQREILLAHTFHIAGSSSIIIVFSILASFCDNSFIIKPRISSWSFYL